MQAYSRLSNDRERPGTANERYPGVRLSKKYGRKGRCGGGTIRVPTPRRAKRISPPAGGQKRGKPFGFPRFCSACRNSRAQPGFFDKQRPGTASERYPGLCCFIVAEQGGFPLVLHCPETITDGRGCRSTPDPDGTAGRYRQVSLQTAERRLSVRYRSVHFASSCQKS